MNFDELSRLLHDAGSGTGAAECHGFLCGYLCINNGLGEEVVKSCLLADRGSTMPTDACVDGIRALAAEVHARITATDFSLQLLLPDDDRPLQERGASLIKWCEGFLSGLGAAGVVRFYSLSTECRELLDDLYKICRLDPDDMSDAGEEEEAALTELIEYVRMGAILMHEEFLQSAENETVTEPVLH